VGRVSKFDIQFSDRGNLWKANQPGHTGRKRAGRLQIEKKDQTNAAEERRGIFHTGSNGNIGCPGIHDGFAGKKNKHPQGAVKKKTKGSGGVPTGKVFEKAGSAKPGLPRGRFSKSGESILSKAPPQMKLRKTRGEGPKTNKEGNQSPARWLEGRHSENEGKVEYQHRP